jgi:hypothetical protein
VEGAVEQLILVLILQRIERKFDSARYGANEGDWEGAAAGRL